MTVEALLQSKLQEQDMIQQQLANEQQRHIKEVGRLKTESLKIEGSIETLKALLPEQNQQV